MSGEWAQLLYVLESLGMDIAGLVCTEDLLLGVPSNERASAGFPSAILVSGAGFDLVDRVNALVERADAARASAGLPCRMVLGRTPTPLFHRRTGLVAPCVDNGNVLGGRAAAAESLLDLLADELAK